MAYDRHDTRDDRSRWQRDLSSGDRQRDFDRESGDRNPNDRGFFERAGDEISSWFGDEDAEQRRRQDHMRDERHRPTGSHDPNRFAGRHQDQHGDYDRSDRSYRPMTGDYGRSERFSGSFGPTRWPGGDRHERGSYDRSQEPFGRDDYRSTSRAGTSDWSDRSRHENDPHYHSWRKQQMESLDRDYDDYRREHQQRFESDFGSWRERRQQKRGLLSQIREHMEVVGNDDQHVGTIDRVAGDRLILTKSDPESGGAHHSLSCSDVERVEGDRIILDCSSEQARQRWRDESRSRALFEREDQGEMGPRTLNRSFEGTYR